MAEQETEEEIWKPKTKLGKKVANGEITDIVEALDYDRPIMEPEIADQLVDLDEEVILIGGTPGKGGGMRRTVSKRTARMHKSGARYSSNAMTVLGDRNRVIGLGVGESEDTRASIEDANREAKLNLIKVPKGNGSWEDTGEDNSSIPFAVEGKSGSVTVELQPAPRGTGLACSDEVKKIMELAGIENVWVQTRGTTQTRENLTRATFKALEKLSNMKTRDEQ
ncbi:30S ribosomal protein S5P [Candidatus Haloredivivus sp. G17]|jgi:small subunit ribosomal protein S5|nr:30S ribosomal protein S5P [Candidatus Haloredivivus sp. G17]